MMKRRTLLGLTVAALVVVGAATPVGAASFTVKCSPNEPGSNEYGSITAALNAAKAVSPRDHLIFVWGNCAETVDIKALDYVRIVGQPGATLSYPSPPPSEPVLNLTDTRGTEITNLTIVGNAGVTVDLVRIFYSTAITFNKVTIKGSGGSGVFVNQGSTVQFKGCVIEGNAGVGVAVGNGSVATFGSNADPSPETATFVQDNGGTGVIGSQNSHVMLGGDVSVLNNGGTGVAATASTIFTCCDTGERRISGNGGSGIAVVGGGDFRTWGVLTIENNRGHGLNLNGSSAQVNGDGGALIIRNNDGYGVVANRNSSVDIYSTLIEYNKGYGVMALDSSTAMIIRSTIQSNGAAGVAAYFLSVALISGGNTITSNGGFDLFCTPDSAGRGTKDGVGKIFCPGFNQFPSPDPGPPR